MFAAVPSHVWVPIIVTYACILPREMTLNVAGAALFPYRACLIAFLPYAFTQALRHLKGFSFIDFVAAFAALWHVVALLVTESSITAFVRSFAQAIDFSLAYLIGRATLRSTADFRAYFLAILPGLLVTAAIMAVESLSGRLILRPFTAQLLGQAPPTSVYERERLGLFRASGPFPHPILGGVFMAATLPLAVYVSPTRLLKAIAIFASLGCIFTVSSTALLALLLCLAIIAMYWLQQATRLPIFAITLLYLALAYVAVSIVSESGPLSVVTRYVLLDPGSSYYRQLIWQYAGAEALNHPFFGIGLRDWQRLDWMIESIDSYWLTSAMRFGFPLAITSFITLAGALFILLFSTRGAPSQVRNTCFAISTTLAVIIFSGFTVHLWEGVAGWMLLIAGAAISLAQTHHTRLRGEPQKSEWSRGMHQNSWAALPHNRWRRIDP